MTKHQFRPCGGGFFRTLTLAAFVFVALAISIALSVTLSTPATALAADSENSVSWTGKYGDTVTLSRLAGENADETATAISQAGFESSDCAVLARMDDFADALGASGLAGTLECPILLTSNNKLSDAAAAELKSLGVKQVYIIGGHGALFEQIDVDLKALGIASERVYGEYAWDTSLKCAQKIKDLGGNPNSEAIVAMSSNFQDALSISTYAYKYHVPLILETNSAQLTSDAISFIKTTTGTIYVPGGTGAVPESSVEGVFTGRTIQRLYGYDGYDTSNQIATYMVKNNLLSKKSVGIASGGQKAHGVDALAGAALVGKQGGVMLLANGNKDMEEVNYTTIDADADSQGSPSFLTKNRLEVIDAYVLGGTVVAPTAFFDKVYKILLYTPEPTPTPDPDPSPTPDPDDPDNPDNPNPETHALPTDGWKLSSDTLTYNGTAQTPSVTAPNNLKEGTDYTVTYSSNTNAGTATVIITGTGTYEGSTELTFTIEKATPDAPADLIATAETNQTLADVALPEVPEGFDGTLAWKDPNVSTGTEAGEITATAIYTPKDTANYTTVEVSVAITVSAKNVFTIVYHGNGGTFDGSDTYTQECVVDTAGELDANKFTNGNKTFGFWTIGTSDAGSIDAASTETCIDGHKFTATGDDIITPTKKGTEVHLYAYWLDEDAGSYWMESANATNPGQTVDTVNGQKNIDANKSNTTFWNNFYNNTGTETHLYTIWQEDTVQVFVNRFVEFRIIQVGAHDGDGSNVTFMATHSLPTAQQMNTTTTNAGGWTGSEMYKAVFGNGSNTEGYVATGLSGLKDAVKTITKKSTAGSYDTSFTDTTSSDAFWLISYSELAGEDKVDWFKNEGTQYDWCKVNVTNPQKSNAAIAGIDKTRAGHNPEGYTSASSGWWLRSPSVNYSVSFGSVNKNGLPNNGNSAGIYLGVAPAFAM